MAALMGLALLPSCAKERAELDVAVAPPVASRFLVHGNCFVGWFLAVDVVVRETTGVDVAVESVSLRIEEASGRLLGERVVDAAQLTAQSGQAAVQVPPHGALHIPMSVGPLEGTVEAPAIDEPVVASGTVVGAAEGGEVRRDYRMAATVTVMADPLPTSGACGAPPG
jgi:hypothetical protein